MRPSKIGHTALLLALLCGAALTIWGLSQQEWPGALPWGGMDALWRYAAFLFFATLLVTLGTRWFRKDPIIVGSMIAGAVTLLVGALWPLLVVIWFALASVVLGQGFMALLRIEKNGLTTFFLVGAGIYGTAVGLLAHFPANYPGIYGVALAAPLILRWRQTKETAIQICTWLQAAQKNNASRCDWLSIAISVVALVYFVVALMPEVGFDSLAMHLFIPAHLALRHQWGFDASTYVWAVMPMLGDWIFSIGYLLAGETAARLINVGFIFILGWLVRDIVRWGGGSAVGAKWAVLIFLTTPLTFMEGSSLFIESIWASFVVAGTLAILNSCSTSGKPRFELPVAGLLLGCALTAKAVTFTILPALLLALVWRYKLWYKTVGLPFLVLGLSVFLAIGLIPYVTAWRLTGNPVFPFFNHIFKSVYYPISVADFATVFEKGLTWDFLYKVTFHSGKYLEATAGAAGFQWLLLFIPVSVAIFTDRHWRCLALLFVGGLSIVLAFHSTSYLRYVFPAWAILTAAIGVALETMLPRYTTVKNLGYIVAATAIGLNLLFLSAGAFYRDFPLKSVTDESSRELYLSGRLPIRSAVELVNRLNTGQTPVAVFGNPLTAGLSGDALYPSWYNTAFQGEIASVNTEQDVANILLKRKVNFIILDSNWNGVNCCSGGAEKQILIEKISEKITEYGGLSVRRVKSDYLFKTELLSNPDFTSIKGWNLAPDAKYDPDTGIILASVSSTAFQAVAVSAGVRYRNTVIARCASAPALGRVQINWIDIKGQFVSADIKTFDCAPTWAEHTMEVAAPPNAVNAVVYVAGQSSIPLEFKGNSLRQ